MLSNMMLGKKTEAQAPPKQSPVQEDFGMFTDAAPNTAAATAAAPT